jgi:hypothetical protein
MVLGLTIYYTNLHQKEVGEAKKNAKENARMSLEDYRIPLFVGDDGIVLGFREIPVESAREEEIIKVEEAKEHWFLEWLQYLE